jgi:predicted ATP-binding protein involved in virulence
MKVKRLKMNSFRGISDLTLEFPTDEPTILIGINGVGKSSILDCLAILLSQLMGRIAQHEDMSVSTNVGANINAGQINIREVFGSVQLNLGDSNKQISFAERNIKVHEFREQDLTNGRNKTQNEITTSLDSREVTWSLTKVRKEHSANTSSHLVELEAIVDDISRQLEASPENNLPLAVYYPVNRAVLNISLEITNEHSFEQIDAYDQALTGVQISFGSFFQWFRAMEDVENEELRDDPDYRDERLEAVRKAIYSLLGEEFSKLRVRRSPLRMTVTKQGQELIVNQLSEGEKNLLALAGDLARRLAIANPGLADPLQGSSVVLIDEIELHLHPKWQREIIPALTRTFPNCQFIVTTHSPQVISEVKPEGIYILEATSEGIIARRPDSSYGRDSNRILEDLMDTPARPQEIKERLLELFRLIAKGDLDSARQLHQKIADEIGADEPELVGASVSIRRREILGR